MATPQETAYERRTGRTPAVTFTPDPIVPDPARIETPYERATGRIPAPEPKFTPTPSATPDPTRIETPYERSTGKIPLQYNPKLDADGNVIGNGGRELEGDDAAVGGQLPAGGGDAEEKGWLDQFLADNPSIAAVFKSMGEHPVPWAVGTVLVSLGMYGAARKWKEFRDRKKAEAADATVV